MKILRVKHTNLFDVFLEDGWKNHARIYFKNGKLSFVGKNNIKLSFPQIQALQIKILMEHLKG